MSYNNELFHGPKPFDNLLDEITEITDDEKMRIEARVERLERIVQTMLLALVRETKSSQEEGDDHLIKIVRLPRGGTF
jgi:hypothetical protein